MYELDPEQTGYALRWENEPKDYDVTKTGSPLEGGGRSSSKKTK
jgi:hypothetical protein